MNLEILVATMRQSDFSLIKKMNLTKSAVIANQCGHWGFDQKETEFGTVRMISSDTVGVGINRNLTLQNAKADYLLFADDDIRYYPGALEGVEQAFKQLPDADVIFFAIDMTKNGEVFDKRRHPTRRLHIWNSLRYGTGRMAIRREAAIKNRLSFSTLFGGGAIYGSGEDTLFILDCFRAGLKVYSHELVLGACAKDDSSWFQGFNEKFVFDKGALIACAFPKTKHLIKWHFIRRFIKKTGLPPKTVIKYINMGIKSFPELKTYREIAEQKEGL